MDTQRITDAITVPGAPDIPGLAFRRFRGEEDYAPMVAVLEGVREADQGDQMATVEEIANTYEHLTNCDPEHDMIMAEGDGRLVGYTRVTWWQQDDGTRIYISLAFLLPEWRRKGIGTALLRANERRLREIAAGHPQDGPRFLQGWVSETEIGHKALVEAHGYTPVTYEAEMVRPDLENIPDAPLPEGLEVRPVRPEHYRPIWEACKEAFRDHWGYTEEEYSEEAYRAWLKNPVVFQPELWKVAWDGDEVAGQVRSFIPAQENEVLNRKRGYTEFISVRRPWRRRGLARALIVQSLHALKARGMQEASLGVHTENPNGAFRLYESVGYQVTKMHYVYRKPLA